LLQPSSRHDLPHAPQLLASFERRFLQAPLQQVSPVPHAMPQAPQCELLDWTLTQLPPQQLRPAAHA
jgi:hypothetical protein